MARIGRMRRLQLETSDARRKDVTNRLPRGESSRFAFLRAILAPRPTRARARPRGPLRHNSLSNCEPRGRALEAPRRTSNRFRFHFAARPPPSKANGARVKSPAYKPKENFRRR